MKYNQLSSKMFVSHRRCLADMMEENAMALVFSAYEMPRSGDQSYPYCQQADLFYLTGIDQPNTILMLCPGHANDLLREVLFIQAPTGMGKVWIGDVLSIEQAQAISGIKTVRYISDMDALVKEVVLSVNGIYFDIPENVHAHSRVEDANAYEAKRFQAMYPLHKYMRMAPLMQYMRTRKTSEELSLIAEACNITALTYMDMLSMVKPGVAEYELEGEIMKGMLCRKATGPGFATIVASGSNACVLHYTANNSICRSGDMLLVDMGAEYAHYSGDLSRTVPVNGRFTARQKAVYEACERVFRHVRTMYVPGMSIAKLQRITCVKMQQELIGLGLFTQKDVDNESAPFACVKRYYMHGVAHFVGLDVHDTGSKDMSLDYGMVLSCEPGIYIPEEGIGVRIETVMQVNDTPIDLMPQVPLSVEEIETYMNR